MSASTRRRAKVLPVGIAATAALLLSACGGGAGGAAPAEVDLGSGPAQAGTVKAGALEGVNMTFASYGGIYQDGQMAAAITPFAEESGARVLSDGPMEYAKIQAQVESNNVTWDVVDTDSNWAAGQCGKLLQKLDYSIIDKSNIPEGLASDCYVPAMQYATVMVYNTEKYSDAPTTWKDFFDTKKYPGKRAIQGNDAGAGIFEGALIADGVAPEDLYPLDIDRALAKLDTIKDSLVYWSTGAQAQQMLEAKEADMAVVWSGRAFGAVENGAPFEPAWDTGVVVMDVLAVPTNAKNPKASMALINYYLGKEQQEKLTEETSYSPVHLEAKPEVNENGRKFLITEPEIAEKVIVSDFAWWGENYADVLEKYTAWVS
ncbi:ABC transporter substrate-binding protein [Arthrobacter mobilis]|uniref:ABC transporter substrate-binding protein n=1 Tax=Arthrobacter mobilis TaxID=2724944 RepID=A0A7X6HCA6_9MICC|nr:ABC transporter substrate-binding protein [Arthrobacter mobilis]NKX53102.1 ABC transporter substrate-binding protein [Arthrobacter mobilis]